MRSQQRCGPRNSRNCRIRRNSDNPPMSELWRVQLRRGPPVMIAALEQHGQLALRHGFLRGRLSRIRRLRHNETCRSCIHATGTACLNPSESSHYVRHWCHGTDYLGVDLSAADGRRHRRVNRFADEKEIGQRRCSWRKLNFVSGLRTKGFSLRVNLPPMWPAVGNRLTFHQARSDINLENTNVHRRFPFELAGS